MTLDQAAFGQGLRVTAFEGLPLAAELRLAALGLRRGAGVTKLLKLPLRDPIECLVGAQLVAVERWVLERVVVVPEQDAGAAADAAPAAGAFRL